MTSEIASATLVQSLLAGLDSRSSKEREPEAGPAHKAASAVERARKRVEEARRVADTSLVRAKAAPRPHEITNPVFVSLFDAHQRDREALFAAMRDLDTVLAAADAN